MAPRGWERCPGPESGFNQLQMLQQTVKTLADPDGRRETAGVRISARALHYAAVVSSEPAADAPEGDRQERILNAVLRLLSQRGIAGVSIRAVAREADVALGLVNYYYDDKISLIRAALIRIEEQDIAMVTPAPAADPEEQLRTVLHRVSEPQFLTTEYLALRLQLWSLAQVHKDFADINTAAQKRYRDGLAKLIRAARPGLRRAECNRRAADVDVVQNGMWLTALLGLDRAAQKRAVRRCEAIALAD